MIDKKNYFEVDIFKIYTNDEYGDDGFIDSQFYIAPSRRYLNFDETMVVYAMLNGMGYRVSNPTEFIESMIAFVFKYYSAMLIAGKLERLTSKDDENDDIYG